MENLNNNSQPVHLHSTYQLLIESEEKERGFVESFVYLMLILATCASIWQFSHQPVTFANIGSALPPPVVATQAVG